MQKVHERGEHSGAVPRRSEDIAVLCIGHRKERKLADSSETSAAAASNQGGYPDQTLSIIDTDHREFGIVFRPLPSSVEPLVAQKDVGILHAAQELVPVGSQRLKSRFAFNKRSAKRVG